MANIEQNICDAIDILVDKAIANAGYDKTIQGHILECTNLTAGEYKIKYQDSEFIAYSIEPDITFEKNTLVNILIPRSDFTSPNKTILSKVRRDLDKASVLDTYCYETIGENINKYYLSIGLSTYETKQEVLYDRTKKDNQIDIDNNLFLKFLQEEPNLLLRFGVQTNMESEQQQLGQYGMIVSLAYSNGTIKDYTLSSSDFNGTPYTMLNKSIQEKVYEEIETKNLVGIEKIVLFCKDFPIQDEKKAKERKDITISDIGIYAAKKIEQSVYAGYRLSFETQYGVTLTDPTSLIEVSASLKNKQKKITSSEYSCYWFREDLSITPTSDSYNSFGGSCWACLNDYYYQEDGTKYWRSFGDSLQIHYGDFLSESQRYKCVVVFNNVNYSNIITLYNSFSSPVLNLTSTNQEEFLKADEGTVLECHVLNDGVEQPITRFFYYWAEADIKGEIIADDARRSYTTFYQNCAKVDTNKIQGAHTYMCSVYGSIVLENVSKVNEYLGTVSIILRSAVDLEKGDGLLTIQGGDQLFKYDAYGASPFAEKRDGNAKPIENLTFTLYSKTEDRIVTGEEIAESHNGKILWSVPQTNTFITDIKKLNDEYSSYYEDNKIIVLNNPELKFNIINEYDPNALSNNTIGLQVLYNGETYNAETRFVFVKDGENGTNGTEYIGIIKSIYGDTSNDYTLTLYNHSSTKEEIQRLGEEYLNALQSPIADLGDLIKYVRLHENENLSQFDRVITEKRFLSNLTVQDAAVHSWILAQAETPETPRSYDDIEETYETINNEFDRLKKEYYYKINELYRFSSNFNVTQDFPPILINKDGYSDGSDRFEATQERWFKVDLWKTANTLLAENTDYTVDWSTYGNKSLYDISNKGSRVNIGNLYSFNEDGEIKELIDASLVEKIIEDESGSLVNAIVPEINISEDFGLTNIVRAEITYDTDKTLYAAKPIITIEQRDTYTISLNPDSGFRNVLYQADGTFPQYNGNQRFEINVDRELDGLLYYFTVVGNDLSLGEGYSKVKYGSDNYCEVNAIPNYSGYDTTNALVCVVVQKLNPDGYKILGWIHIPIYMSLNRYGLAHLNAWDGNSVEVADGYILAPQVGAGKKESDNSFTGVLMGTVKVNGSDEDDTGLFGYSYGNRSFFLDAEHGTALFGPNENNGIMINPGYEYNEQIIDRGECYISGNYLEKTEDEDGHGIKIGFYPEGYIYSGDGSFKLDKEGLTLGKGTKISWETKTSEGETQEKVDSLENYLNSVVNTDSITQTVVDKLKDDDSSGLGEIIGNAVEKSINNNKTITNLQTQIDKKIDVYTSVDNPKTNEKTAWNDADDEKHIGDIWSPMDGSGQVYSYSQQGEDEEGNPLYGWERTDNQQIAIDLNALDDEKIEVWYGDDDPQGLSSWDSNKGHNGDLWYKTVNGETKLYVYQQEKDVNGKWEQGEWNPIEDSKINEKSQVIVAPDNGKVHDIIEKDPIIVSRKFTPNFILNNENLIEQPQLVENEEYFELSKIFSVQSVSIYYTLPTPMSNYDNFYVTDAVCFVAGTGFGAKGSGDFQILFNYNNGADQLGTSFFTSDALYQIKNFNCYIDGCDYYDYMNHVLFKITPNQGGNIFGATVEIKLNNKDYGPQGEYTVQNGDLWYNTLNKKLYVYSSKTRPNGETFNVWDEVQTEQNESILSTLISQKIQDSGILNNLENLQDQIDGKIEVYTSEGDPKTTPETAWNDEDNEKHIGDIWSPASGDNQGLVFTYTKGLDENGDVQFQWERTDNKQIDIDLKQLDDEKIEIWSSPSNTKPDSRSDWDNTKTHNGDIWYQTDTHAMLVCSESKDENDETIYTWNPIEDNTKVQNFVCGQKENILAPNVEGVTFRNGDLWYNTTNNILYTYQNGRWNPVKAEVDLSQIQGELDSKIQTFVQENDPSTSWTSNDEKAKHKGDLWYDTENGELKSYNGTANSWTVIKDEKLQSIVLNKPTIFLSLEELIKNGYKKGDIYQMEELPTSYEEVVNLDEEANPRDLGLYEVDIKTRIDTIQNYEIVGGITGDTTGGESVPYNKSEIAYDKWYYLWATWLTSESPANARICYYYNYDLNVVYEKKDIRKIKFGFAFEGRVRITISCIGENGETGLLYNQEFNSAEESLVEEEIVDIPSYIPSRFTKLNISLTFYETSSKAKLYYSTVERIDRTQPISYSLTDDAGVDPDKKYYKISNKSLIEVEDKRYYYPYPNDDSAFYSKGTLLISKTSRASGDYIPLDWMGYGDYQQYLKEQLDKTKERLSEITGLIDSLDSVYALSSTLNTVVNNYLGYGGGTLVDERAIISPYIGGGYLFISNGATTYDSDDISNYVIINPNAEDINNFSIIEAGMNGEPIFKITPDGDAYFKGRITATELMIKKSNSDDLIDSINLLEDLDGYIHMGNGQIILGRQDDSNTGGYYQTAITPDSIQFQYLPKVDAAPMIVGSLDSNKLSISEILSFNNINESGRWEMRSDEKSKTFTLYWKN